MVNSALNQWQERLLFLRKFLQQGRRIASLTPSSKSLAQAMCRYIDPTISQTILELGAGTGAVTEVALQKMHKDSRIIALETDNEFAVYLRKRCPKALVLTCGAENMMEQLASLKIKEVDVILDELPTPSLSARLVADIFLQCKKLTKNAHTPITQITSLPWLYLRWYQTMFEKVEFAFVLKSFPPAGVYYCWNYQT